RRRAHDQQPGARARFLNLNRDHPRRLRTAEAARACRTSGIRRRLGRDQRPLAGVQESLLGHHRVSGKPGGRQTQRLALPCGGEIPLRLRGWTRALLLAATGLPSRAARVVYGQRYSTRVLDAQTLRTLLHGGLRPSRVDDGLLEKPPT